VLLEGSLPALGLPEIVAARAQLDLLEKALVVEARRQWATWAEIGELLGLSPQATWKRFRPLDPRPPRRTQPESIVAATVAETLNPR
jgi:hypothetical protein